MAVQRNDGVVFFEAGVERFGEQKRCEGLGVGVGGNERPAYGVAAEKLREEEVGGADLVGAGENEEDAEADVLEDCGFLGRHVCCCRDFVVPGRAVRLRPRMDRAAKL